MYLVSVYDEAAKKWVERARVDAPTVSRALNIYAVKMIADGLTSRLVLVGSTESPALATYRVWWARGEVIQERVTP